MSNTEFVKHADDSNFGTVVAARGSTGQSRRDAPKTRIRSVVQGFKKQNSFFAFV